MDPPTAFYDARRALLRGLLQLGIEPLRDVAAAAMLREHAPVRTDHEECRNRVHAEIGSRLVGPHDLGMMDPFPERSDLLGVLGDGEQDDLDAAVLPTASSRIERRKAVETGTAPRRPDVDETNAGPRREPTRSVLRLHRQVGERRAHPVLDARSRLVLLQRAKRARRYAVLKRQVVDAAIPSLDSRRPLHGEPESLF